MRPSDVHPNDEFYEEGWQAHYWSVGESFRRIAGGALLARSQSILDRPIQRVLDFGCGHGRVTRVMRRMWPEADIVASDIDAERVGWCVRQFGCTPYQSSTDIEAVSPPGSFDFIFVGSVITHLEEDKSALLIRILAEHLNTDGILILSSHGRRVAALMREASSRGEASYGLRIGGTSTVLAQYDVDGYGYADYPGQSGYGISVIAPEWFFRQLTQLHGTRLSGYGEMLWDQHHDIVTLQRTDIRVPYTGDVVTAPKR